MKKLNWGVLSTAKIGIKNVIPAIQRSKFGTVTAISSRNLDSAKSAAAELGLEKAYGNYDELLEDDSIDIIYNPLPNHFHVPYTIKALKAGKHVLCEKPISVNYNDAVELLKISKKYPNLKLMEAFMYRFHPQWHLVKNTISSGQIGDIKHVHSTFSYFNNNPNNIKNQVELGGGGLLDIGCYCVNFSRFIFDEEPLEIDSFMDFDPDFKTDRVATGLLKFKNGAATFMCGMQVEFDQKAQIFGSKGKIEIEIPFNDANEIQRKVIITKDRKSTVHFFEPCDQYTLQADAFARSILENSPVPLPLEDAVGNMRVISQMFTNYLK